MPILSEAGRRPSLRQLPKKDPNNGAPNFGTSYN